MRRRRLIVIVVGAVLLAVGVSWWLTSDGLTATERQLVGSWRAVKWQEVSPAPGQAAPMVFHADRRVECEGWLPTRWSAQGDHLTLDTEPSAFGRFVRPIASRVGMPVNGFTRYPFEFTDGLLTMHMPDGTKIVCERIAD
jgi:hypothetical protein